MNKKDVERVKNRIAQMESEMEANLEMMRVLRDKNLAIKGAIVELALMITNLTPEKKVPEKKEKKVKKK